jgi:hypothetical protein
MHYHADDHTFVPDGTLGEAENADEHSYSCTSKYQLKKLY